MGRPTSNTAYGQSTAAGNIKASRSKVLQAFKDIGPGTSAEVLSIAGLDINRNLMRARVTELADSGHLVEETPRMCTVTGRTSIVWRPIGEGETPVPREKHVSMQMTLSQVSAVEKAVNDGSFPSELNDVFATIIDAYERFLRNFKYRGTLIPEDSTLEPEVEEDIDSFRV